MKMNAFYLTLPQKEKLVQEAKKLDINNSELLRRILDKYFEEKEKQSKNERRA